MNNFLPFDLNAVRAGKPAMAAHLARLLVTGALAMPALVAAQTVSDFKSASERNGCASVPYSGKRSDCESIQREIDANCKTDAIDCVDLYKIKADVIKSIENQKKEIGNIENKRAGLVKERDNYPKEQEAQIKSWNEKIKTVDEDIANAKKKLDETAGKLKNFDSDNKVVAGYERAQKCADNRKRSNTLFGAVMEDLYKEPTKTLGSTPGEGVTYNAQKRELEAYAVKIVDGIKKEIAGHTTAQTNAENR
ncbi:MAG: hypothetical protein RL341_270, partial [Pseudomonadota bacterium]